MDAALPSIPHPAPASDPERRTWLIATSTAGGVAAVATAVPFVSTLAPSERARAAGAPVEVDIGDIPPGGMKVAEWRGKPVWVVHRTPEMIAALSGHDAELADPMSKRDDLAPALDNPGRSMKPEWFVAIGICTHLGCSPVGKFAKQAEAFDPNWQGGFYCPCHGSLFDLAGRVYKNKPAPDNLVVPPHKYLSDTRIVIGEDTKGA